MHTKKKGRKRGGGTTSLDPNVLKQSKLSAPSREYGTTNDLAEKALHEQALRNLSKGVKFNGSLQEEKIETPVVKAEPLQAPRKLSTSSQDSQGSRTSQISFSSGPPGYEATKGITGTQIFNKRGTSRKRKTHRRKKSHRRR